jgi:hypothetical protein
VNDWKEHKLDCKDLAKGQYGLVENRHRAATSAYLADAGFSTTTMG